MNQPKPKTKKTCESCGENFDCGANAEKCWCFEIDLSAEILQDLRENFNNCLCPKCLKSEPSAVAGGLNINKVIP